MFSYGFPDARGIPLQQLIYIKTDDLRPSIRFSGICGPVGSGENESPVGGKPERPEPPGSAAARRSGVPACIRNRISKSEREDPGIPEKPEGIGWRADDPLHLK